MTTSPWEVGFTGCAARRLSPRIRRMVSQEPVCGGEGLRTYIVGAGEVAVIDPAPNSRPLLDAICGATAGERITHVLLTHAHGRRSPLAAELADRHDAAVLGPNQGLHHGQRIAGPGWTLQALATPGHTADHFGFALEEENVLFCGELLCGWSADLAISPDGDLRAALTSLVAARRVGFHRLLPAIGPEIVQVDDHITACLMQSARRERQILNLLQRAGACSAWEMAEGCDAHIHGLVEPAAADLLLAYLTKLAGEGWAVAAAKPTLFSRFAAAAPAAGFGRSERRGGRKAGLARQAYGHGIDSLCAFPFGRPATDAHPTSLETAQRQTGAQR